MRTILISLLLLGFASSNDLLAQQNAVTPSSKILVEQLQSEAPGLYKVEKRVLNNYALPSVQLSDVQTQNVRLPASAQLWEIPETYTPKVFIGRERKQAIAYILVPQYIRTGPNTLQQVLSYNLSISESNAPLAKNTGSRVYAAHSVLSSGQFYRLQVATAGVYKIDYAFIKNNTGIEPASRPSSSFRLFGNGGQALAEDNAIPRADDLTENALAVYDGGDGIMNPGDYFLFYATGPHRIQFDSVNKRFTHANNPYSDVSAYFLQVDGSNGLRMTSEASASNFNTDVNDYDYFYYYDKDSANLGKYGKDWWGDEFSNLPGRYLTRTYPLLLNDIVPNSTAVIRTRLGVNSATGVSQMSVSLNNTLLHAPLFQPNPPVFSQPVVRINDNTSLTTLPGLPFNITIQMNLGSSSASGFLDFLEVNLRRQLQMQNGILAFSDANSIGTGKVARFNIGNANSNTLVWDVSNPLKPVHILGQLNGNVYQFNRDASRLNYYTAFDLNASVTPQFSGLVANQDLHALSSTNYIIITHPNFLSVAGQLAQHHAQKRGIQSLIVTPQQIYNEFSSGTQDVSALRDFIKMLYDKGGLTNMPEQVLFLGDASYDYKDRIANNTNFVPTYETNESSNKTLSYCTDDFFGFLDDDENINNYDFLHINTLDIGIGRLTVSTVTEALAILNKIKIYDSSASFGPWKNTLSFAADDGDSALHLDDAEIMANYARDSLPVYNNYKFYVDAFTLQATPAGPRAPDANKALVANLYNGSLLMNYNGHGGPLGWCEERIFSMDDINDLNNLKKLPLFITATCDFAPFDNPAIQSAGEILLRKPDGGAIGLMTTTQLVYADQNRIMNLNYMIAGFKPMANGKNPSMGDAYRLSKNLRYVNGIDEYAASNFRKFALLGDPALPLAFPKHRVVTDSINGVSVQTVYDTLNALGKYTISGHINDAQGQFLSNYNGVVSVTLFDKPRNQNTLQNNPSSSLRTYALQNNALYKGKATVSNGRFSLTFVVPKDINYSIGRGKISYYVQNDIEDGNGYDQGIWVGGSSANPSTDQTGPIIKPFMNSERFVDGGITTPNSTLLVKLFDSNGINYTGNSIGHDITVQLDGDPQKTYVLNQFYEADLDQFQSGMVRFPLNNLSEGMHSAVIKAWDVFNNSNEARLNFVVTSTEKGKLDKVYNYPNPFSTSTQFMFEHNTPNQLLQIDITIYTVTGVVVRRIHEQRMSEGTRINDIVWDGCDTWGDKLANGVYLYKVNVRSASGSQATKLEKLVILR
jgi:hypothetical protein